jgi:NAD-dependent SIR2 family protein deacetylase
VTLESQLRAAVEAIASADAMLIGAGAGMGVDSGLPDFRGNVGFWVAYPPYAQLGLDFVALANPHWFDNDPELAWGFYGHRLNLYRGATPHDGFRILRTWGQRMRHGAFVFTSNVDGHFQKAGFDPDRIVEVHGTIHRLQCMASCGIDSFATPAAALAIDETSMRAGPPLPICPACGALARPNILMFGDSEWDALQAGSQQVRLKRWLGEVVGTRLVIVECGAGVAIPTVRWYCETTASAMHATLIRINPREPEVPREQIGIPAGALQALSTLDQYLRTNQ